ncbi:hypothetical protein SRB5_54060 [Streptomyces sp. RB5]|uniref:Uncharacterized protein n=1 Tax=Streptomyces smaragdinus TaxID=2585196 RepID=A0A7K0CP04_9ACTN|nr:hypothetical protein [Streptomyces smaragdinus]MQY15227.1 hypothetical protein [Streptomyces smaragdinus]
MTSTYTGGGGEWTQLDEYLWHTCDILADLIEDRLDQRALVPTFARVDAGDRVLASGPAQRLTWRGYGNGSYTHSNVMALGGPAFVIGTMVGNAIGNNARKRAAENAAQPRWIPDGVGEVSITTRKVYFGHPETWLDLHWDSLDQIDLIAPEFFQTTFRNSNAGNQSLSVQIHSPWASLIFVLAALTSFPAHPRLLGHGWLPPDFESRCTAMGRPCRPAPGLVIERATRGPR